MAAQKDDEKYDKIHKQQSKIRTIVIVVVMTFVGLVLAFYSQNNGSPTTALTTPDDGQVVPKQMREKPLEMEHPVKMEYLVNKVQELDSKVRKIKQTGVIMETDKDSLAATKKLQEATRKLLAARYGLKEPYRINVSLKFQDSIADFKEKGPDGSILLEMAPTKLVPHSVFTFMEIARQWKGGAFHRIAGHVLQAQVRGPFHSLAFQEYSAEYPHKKGTVGYAGRPSGPAWYVSILDNTRNHGPGSQQKHNPYEADSCFGRVIKGFDTDVQRIASIPDKGFLSDAHKHVIITGMTILVPGSGPSAVDGYVEWKSNE